MKTNKHTKLFLIVILMLTVFAVKDSFADIFGRAEMRLYKDNNDVGASHYSISNTVPAEPIIFESGIGGSGLSVLWQYVEFVADIGNIVASAYNGNIFGAISSAYDAYNDYQQIQNNHHNQVRTSIGTRTIEYPNELGYNKVLLFFTAYSSDDPFVNNPEFGPKGIPGITYRPTINISNHDKDIVDNGEGYDGHLYDSNGDKYIHEFQLEYIIDLVELEKAIGDEKFFNNEIPFIFAIHEDPNFTSSNNFGLYYRVNIKFKPKREDPPVVTASVKFFNGSNIVGTRSIGQFAPTLPGLNQGTNGSRTNVNYLDIDVKHLLNNNSLFALDATTNYDKIALELTCASNRLINAGRTSIELVSTVNSTQDVTSLHPEIQQLISQGNIEGNGRINLIITPSQLASGYYSVYATSKQGNDAYGWVAGNVIRLSVGGVYGFQKPSISDFSPETVFIGNNIEIHGSNFIARQGQTTYQTKVYIGDDQIIPTSIQDNLITLIINKKVTGIIKVWNLGGETFSSKIFRTKIVPPKPPLPPGPKRDN